MKNQSAIRNHRFRIRRQGRAHKLTIRQQYARVIEMCTDYLANKLTINNCIDMIFFSTEHGMERLSQMTAMFIDVNFEKVFTSDEFLELSLSKVEFLMSLLIQIEMTNDDVGNAILLWNRYQQSKRKKNNRFIRPNYRLMIRGKDQNCINVELPATEGTKSIRKAIDRTDSIVDTMPSPPPPPLIA